MLFYRSKSGGRQFSLATNRTLTSLSLIAYPVGALLVRFAAPVIPSLIIGNGLIAVSLICVAAMMNSSIQRIVGEQADKLDEYELKLRARAVSAAYVALATLALLAIIYLAIAADKGGWVPSTYGEFGALFWGLFIYASMLPSLFLVWQIDPADAAPEAPLS